MRLLACAFAICLATGAQAQSVSQGCLVIADIDRLHDIQTRLARNPDSVMFVDDIRMLRKTVSDISDRAALEAVESNTLAIKGNTFTRFLQNTRALLELASLDDPNSVAPHFTSRVRTNLANVRSYLVDLRCTAEEIAAAEDAAAVAITDTSDDDAVEIIREAAQQLISWTNLFLFTSIGLSTLVIIRLWHRFSVRRKRRAKRHAVTYKTAYRLANATRPGRLIDINCYGTKLRHGQNVPPSKGTALDVLIGDDWVSASVMWTNAHYAGVQFKRSVSLDVVQEVRTKKGATPQKQSGAQLDAA
ncbi:hypothetical protein [Cognatiyoonia sp. IB215182]|uniref:hypothetical protein n=1 Tax=Cognatiyoonia sp. IB215182 TaxID=3097353 RepID=UPI002A10969A|nr:hypothetical protein [Cognatiyoonia sp. IB215182]MDX8352228.1 hypothetical protein [Cognatiyoonia sp. IB215182]